jgi:hypothetical protein
MNLPGKEDYSPHPAVARVYGQTPLDRLGW